jgi:hypothetical protein
LAAAHAAAFFLLLNTCLTKEGEMRIGITKSVLAASLVVMAAACRNDEKAPEPQAVVAVKDSAKDSTRAFGGRVRDDRGRPILTSRPDALPRRDDRVKRLHLDSGTEIEAVAVNAITSRTNHAGDRVTARVVTAVLDGDRDTVIPVGATLTGVVQAIASAENPREEGVLRNVSDSRGGEGDGRGDAQPRRDGR